MTERETNELIGDVEAMIRSIEHPARMPGAAALYRRLLAALQEAQREADIASERRDRELLRESEELAKLGAALTAAVAQRDAAELEVTAMRYGAEKANALFRGEIDKLRAERDTLTAALAAIMEQGEAFPRCGCDGPAGLERCAACIAASSVQVEGAPLTAALADATRAREALQVIASDECEWMTSPADRCPQAATPLANYCHTCRARHALAEPHP